MKNLQHDLCFTIYPENAFMDTHGQKTSRKAIVIVTIWYDQWTRTEAFKIMGVKIETLRLQY